MIVQAIFLVAALAVRPAFVPVATPVAIRVYQMMKSEEERLRQFIDRYAPNAEVFIHPRPQKDKLKEAGFERVPWTWRGNEIWIQRKPKSDEPPKKRSIGASA